MFWLQEVSTFTAFRVSAEVYDWVSNSWSGTGSMGVPRMSHTATLLANGQVLVAGGENASGSVNGAELYNSASGIWSVTGDLGVARYSHTASLLNDGEVLVAGGTNGSVPLVSSEIYSPGSQSWTPTGNLLQARVYHTATFLFGGKILVAGGSDGTNSLASAEIFDPVTGHWTNTGALLAARQHHTATLLPSGRVYVAGGFDSSGYPIGSAEIYDPATGVWTVTGSLITPRGNHTASLLPNGDVLISGGEGTGLTIFRKEECFVPAAGISVATGDLGTVRRFHTATLLRNGRVLLAGGLNDGFSTNNAELYNTGQGFLVAGTPVISAVNSPSANGGALTVAGTNFRGLFGGGDGTSHDDSCNYPLAQLRSLETGQTAFLPSSAVAGQEWSATSFASAPIVGFGPGYAAVTIYTGGTPSVSVITSIVPPNSDLSGLSVSAGPISPAFDPARTSYSVDAPDSVLSTTVTAQVSDPKATLKINGMAANSGVASQIIPLVLGANLISTVVTGADGVTTKTYTTTVTVHDVTAPVITFHASDLTAEATGPNGATVTYAAATATDNSGVSPTITYSMARGAVFPLGATTVTVTAKDVPGNASTATFKVLVQDTTGPQITVLGDNPATAFQGATYRDAGATASDLVSGDVAVSTTGTVNIDVLGSNTVTYHATDAAGNTATATRTVNVITAPAGTVQAFDPGLLQAGGGAGTMRAVAQQADGKLLIAGRFDQAGGEPHANLVRLSANGTVDSQFTAGTDGAVNSVVVQPDGQILLGGSFGMVNNQASGCIARLNADGSLEGTETIHAGTGADGEVKKVVLQADGKILLAGLFQNVNGEGRACLARLLPDGTLENTVAFDPGAGPDGPIRQVAEQLDGRIVIVGDFTHVAGAGRLGLACLNPDGSLENASAFHTFASIDGAISALAVQPDGHILIGGDFTSIDGQPQGHIARLLSDGNIESSTTFNPGAGADGSVRSIALQANGAILLGGFFSQVNTQSRDRIARLNADGTVQDAQAFNAGTDGGVELLALEGDGRLVMGGAFTEINGETRNGFALLANDPATASLTVPDSTQVQWQRGGAAPELAWATFEVSTDAGATWMPLPAGRTAAGGWQITSQSLPFDVNATLRAHGYFEGASGIVEAKLDFNVPDTSPPKLTTVSISSNNFRPMLAKAGDVITLSFTANETIQAPVVTLAGMTALPVNPAGNLWTAAVTVAAGGTQGEAPYSIVFQDLAGNPGATATAPSDGSRVVIDTVAPTIIVPPNQMAVATGPDGAFVNYPSASATDSGQSINELFYSHERDTKFPIGLTSVLVLAVDEAGNVAAALFQVTVGDQRESLPAATGDFIDGAFAFGSNVPAFARWYSLGVPGLDSGGLGLDDGAPVFRGSFRLPTGVVGTGIFGIGSATPLVVKTGDLAAGASRARYKTLGDPLGNGGTFFPATLVHTKGGPAAGNDHGLWANVFPDGGGEIYLVARQGSPAADLSGATYNAFTAMALNDGGNLFWTATLKGVPAAQKTALFAQRTLQDGPHLLLQSGQQVTNGQVPQTVQSFVALGVSGAAYGDGLPGGSPGYGSGRANGGEVTPVLLNLSGRAKAVATVGLGHPLAVLAVTGGTVPGSAGMGNSVWKTLGQPAGGGSGMVAFRASVASTTPGSGITTNNAEGLFMEALGQPLTLLGRQGDAAPGFPELHYAAFGDPFLNSDGDVLFFARLANAKGAAAGEALYWQPAGDPAASLVASTIDASPIGAETQITRFTGAALPGRSGSEMRGPVFTATLKNAPDNHSVKQSNNQGLWAVDSAGHVQLLARTGSGVNGKTLKTIGAFQYVVGSPMQARAAAAASSVIYLATFTDQSSAIIRVPIP